MPTRKVHGSWWVDFTYHGARHRIRSPDNTREGAAVFEASLRRRLALGENLDSLLRPRPTLDFAQFTELFLRDHVQPNNKYSEQRNKKQVLQRHLLPHFARLRLPEITTQRIAQFAAEKHAEGLSAKTVFNVLSVLGRVLSLAVEWEHLDECPKIRKPRLEPPRFDFFTFEEGERLLRVIDDSFWYTFVLFALRTGMRFGEIIGLEWPQVDLVRADIHVCQALVRGRVCVPKSNRFRHVPISPDLRRVLEQASPKVGLVFGRGPTRRPPDHGTARRALRHYCDRAGLRRIKIHALRHSFASQLEANGVSLLVIQELLGHSDIKTTLRYAHLEPIRAQLAVETLERGPTRDQQQLPAVDRLLTENAANLTPRVKHGML